MALKPEAKAEIKTWFQWWRERRATVEKLQANVVDASILLFAALDALANWWGAFRSLSGYTHARRFGEMLSKLSGDDHFNRISLPHVWYRAQIDSLDQPFRSVVEGFRRVPNSNESRLRMFADDPLSTEVLADNAVTAFLTVKVSANPNKPVFGNDWILGSRYGEIVYTHYRCPWLHELRPGMRTLSMRDAPGYMSPLQSVPPVVDFPIGYMARIFASCVDEFELLALAEERKPVQQQDAVGWVPAS